MKPFDGVGGWLRKRSAEARSRSAVEMFEALENRQMLAAYVPPSDVSVHMKLSDATSFYDVVPPVLEGTGTPAPRGSMPTLGDQNFTAFRVTTLQEGNGSSFTPASLGTKLLGIVTFLEYESSFIPNNDPNGDPDPSLGGRAFLGDSTRPHTTAPDPTGLGRATLGRFFLFDNSTGSEFFNTAGNQADDVLFNDNQFGYQIDSLSGVVGGTLLATGSLIDNDANPFDGQIQQVFTPSSLAHGIEFQSLLGGQLGFDGGAWFDAGIRQASFSVQLYTIAAGATAQNIQGGLIRPDVFEGGWLASSEDPISTVPGVAAVDIEKFVNGNDADNPTGPVVPVGSTVTWTYEVRNTGTIPLSIVVTDDNGTPGNPADDFNPAPLLSGGFNVGDTDQDGLLDVGEVWQYQASGTAVAGQYTNVATVVGTPVPAGQSNVTDNDPANYFGATPGINIVKLTNGTDNNSPTGPVVPVGSTVTFTYIVTNTGNVPLSNVVVRDDNGTPGNLADDFNAAFVGGDTDADTLLDVTETWTFTASRIATAGQYVNNATVTSQGPNGETPTDSDVDHHFGEVQRGGEGLTPGFWKQGHHFQFWVGFTTNQSFNTVFGLVGPNRYPGNPTLLQVLKTGGGGHEALGRHAVAALLNASNPNINYFYTPAEVIQIVQNAFATGDYETAKDLLEAQNELGGVDKSDL